MALTPDRASHWCASRDSRRLPKSGRHRGTAAAFLGKAHPGKTGQQQSIGKEVSRYEQGKSDFIENIDDICIHYDGGRVAANEALIAEISACGLRQTTRDTGLDRKTIRAVLNRKKVKIATLARIVIGLQRN